jgi:hypothetical protein
MLEPYRITDDQLASYRKDGYVVLPKFIEAAEADRLLARAHELLRDFELDGHPMTRFTTSTSKNEKQHVGDDYFLTSGDKIRAFFEQDAFDADGKLNRCVRPCSSPSSL